MPLTETFLVDPARSPEMPEGEPWGNEELYIDFAGGHVPSAPARGPGPGIIKAESGLEF
jgi:hypothetical protein